jgi:membrane protein
MARTRNSRPGLQGQYRGEYESRAGRPAPDEAPLEASLQPQPEPREPRREVGGPSQLSSRDWLAIVKRAGKETIADNMPMIAQALAYSTFMAIPSALLVVLGVFTLVAGPQTILSVMHHLSSVMPAQATQLLGSSLTRLTSHHSAGITMTIVGLVLAIWSTTGAMTAYMAGLNIAYEREETRGFVRKRLVALAMVACITAAFLLVAVLLIFGPVVEHYLGRALGIPGVFGYVWWAAQWPILIGGLLVAFATLLYLGPNVDHPRWSFLSVGTAVAVGVWLAVSGLFAVYTSMFGSYNKTWGSLAAVIVMLTWLWLSSLALLFGGEVNAEVERSRELRAGQPAQRELQVPVRG